MTFSPLLFYSSFKYKYKYAGGIQDEFADDKESLPAIDQLHLHVNGYILQCNKPSLILSISLN